jgi:hypothetical protein
MTRRILPLEDVVDYLAGFVSVLVSTACSDVPCAVEETVGPTISVQDGETHQSICDAKVLVLSDASGSGSESAVESVTKNALDAGVDGELPLSVTRNSDGSCVYVLSAGFVTPHVYSLQVSRSGYATEAISNVYDSTGECVLPTSQMIVVSFQPAGS